MKVLFENRQRDLPLSEEQVKNLVASFLRWKRAVCDEVGVYFVDEAAISALHATHFNDPSPTDCISFPMDPPFEKKEGDYSLLGEIFVCPSVALSYAHAHQLNPYEELSLYMVHALLHLLGFDDRDEETEKEMREAENSAMRYLKEKQAVLHG